MTTLHHSLQGGEMMLQVSGLALSHLQGWIIVSPDGSLRPGEVNPPHHTDPRLAGWLKVEDGSVRPPSRQVISGGVHITTEDCRQQSFSADLTGLNLSPGTRGDLRLDHLSWAGGGARVVTDGGQHSVRLGLLLRAPGGVRLFGNQTRLGSWAASLVLTRSQVRLNITTHQSQGLILGLILGHTQNISFSFFVSSPAQSSVSTLLPLLVPGLRSDSVRLCLRVLTTPLTCQDLTVETRDQADLHHKYSSSTSDVQPIPVMWHLDSPPVAR